MDNLFTSFEELPLLLSISEVAQVLSISRANAYALAHTDGFPTLYLGKRMLVDKYALFNWLEQQTRKK